MPATLPSSSTTLSGKQQLPPTLPGFEGINRYWDRINSKVAAKILPGQYYVTLHDELIVTVLGSCVSACIRDPRKGIGGMNHFMLPMETGLSTGNWGSKGLSAATRYGNVAMEYLINGILRNGGDRHNLEVKIFGGGKILAQMTDIGQRNIAFIREYVQVEGLKLVADDLGDICPRKVYYYPGSGVVRVKKLRALHDNTLVEREMAYVDELRKAPVAGEIDLF